MNQSVNESIGQSINRPVSQSIGANRSDEGLTLETSAFRISVRWPIYIINSVDKTKFLYTTSPPTQHHSFFRNYPFSQSIGQPINQSISQSIGQSVNQSINRSIGQSINQSVNQSVSQSISQSINQSIGRSIN